MIKSHTLSKDEKPHRPRWGYFADPSKPVTLEPQKKLSIQDLVAAARGDGRGSYPEIRLAGDWSERCNESREHIELAIRNARAKWSAHLVPPRAELIYGVLTGFGGNKDKPLTSDDEVHLMQENILRSHATGTGKPLPSEVVRAMMLIRARAFIEGHSGVRPAIPKLLVDMLNAKVHPWVPEQGSVGSSGDLCPLAHLALTMIGDGFAWVADPPTPMAYDSIDGGKHWNVVLERRPAPMPAEVAFKEANLKTLKPLEAKEGLALTNGASLSAALTSLAVYDADVLIGMANLCAASSLQAMLGFTRAYDEKVQKVRLHSGQAEAALQVMKFAEGSKLLNRADDVQDPYSLRCVPQVHGAAVAAVDHVWEIIENEINAVTDNPLFFVGEAPSYNEESPVCVWAAYSAGNFHGEPVGMVADYLKIAVSELANISERRIQTLLDSNHNRGLLGNLSPKRPGLNSGYMISQYTAASLVSENKVLSHPASVDSIPTSSNAEDHVSMAPIAGRHAREVVANVRNVLSIELVVVLQALELRYFQRARYKELESKNLQEGTPEWEDLQSLKNTPRKNLIPEGPLEDALSPATKVVHDLLRGERKPIAVEFFYEDKSPLWENIATTNSRIATGELLKAALSASTGPA